MAPQVDTIEIQTVDGSIDLTIRPPGSKSITNRVLLCAALANGQSRLRGVLDSDDTKVMIDCLNELGVDIQSVKSEIPQLQVAGCSGNFPNRSGALFVENSGTTIRFLTAALALHGGQFRLHGIDRMHERPIGPLVDALNKLKLNVVAESSGGCPPVVIENERVSESLTEISGAVSSQYLSGLMMAAPLADGGMEVRLLDELVSKPYVKMTHSVMQSFGVSLELDLDSKLASFSCGPNQCYSGCDYDIEPDASAASYFWAAAAICGGRTTVLGLNRDTLQGDVEFVECLKQMGCEVEYSNDSISVSGRAKSGIDVDMSDISDTVQTLSVVALFVEGETRIRGVAHNRVKETDRIGDLATELRKLGAKVDELEDGLSIVPGKLKSAEIETYNDHRMAMSLSLAGLRQTGVVITNPGCTAKTYPHFFEDLAKIYG